MTARSLTLAAAVAVACAGILASGCRAEPRHICEAARTRSLLEVVLHPGEPDPSLLVDPIRPAATRVPWAGTVSHHLLAASLIDSWYARLAAQGDYRLLFVVSPKHHPVGSELVALSDLDWEAGNGIVRVDRPTVRTLASRLGVRMEHQAFYGEHGVGTQVPFIRKHFPHARIVPIVLEEQRRRSDVLRGLAEALLPYFRGRNDTFLLVSTDFAHHADATRLARSDELTMRFLRSVSVASAPLAGCDCKAGMMVLAYLAEMLARGEAIVYAHADSGRLSGVARDMTSYFFTYFY